MYDLPGLDAATDAWWAGLAAAFRAEGLQEVPDNLTRGDDVLELWTAPDLFFSQTCGYPLTHALAGEVALVATPVYACPGCAGGAYHSEILVRADDSAKTLAELRGRCVAMNGADSQSGCSALRHAVAGLAGKGRFFAAVKTSGSHLKSMRMVAEGTADVCAIDTVTYHLIARTQPELTFGTKESRFRDHCVPLLRRQRFSSSGVACSRRPFWRWHGIAPSWKRIGVDYRSTA
jgi:ABC-type phosphate/phosphonate transport system substrate-binding protein